MQINICSTDLPVNEKLEIKKNRIAHKNNNGKRISIVTGIHGDELEGQYVCYELQRRIRENFEKLKGIVDIYPCMNPMGMDSITRGIPFFDLDMNRIFPGNKDGTVVEYIASKMIEDLENSDLVIDIHASNIYLTEIPQIRINELHKDVLVPLAKLMNVDFVWIHQAATVLESTLAHSLNHSGTKTLVVEMGVGMRITKEYGDQLVDGIFRVMQELDVWEQEEKSVKTPMISEKANEVYFFNAKVGGVFLPEVSVATKLKQGDRIGKIIEPLEGKVLDIIKAPFDGLIFTIRDYPIVDEGSLIGRMLVQQEETDEA